jgi:hypothetical protein
VKSGEFSSLLGAYADMLETAGAADARAQIVKLAAIFEIDPSSTVVALAKRLATVPTSGTASGTNLSGVVRLLAALKEVLGQAAKAGVLADISAIEKVLRDRASMDIDGFVQLGREAMAPRPKGVRGAKTSQSGLVLHYKEQLEAALGDEEKFASIMRDLRSDQTIAKGDIFALAKEMTGGGARTIDAAFKKIWSRHQAVAVFRAKTRASGGRSAA